MTPQDSENPETVAAGLDALVTFRFDQFSPPCWQIWDAPGERLLAAFATKPMLDAALPALRGRLLERNSDHG